MPIRYQLITQQKNKCKDISSVMSKHQASGMSWPLAKLGVGWVVGCCASAVRSVLCLCLLPFLISPPSLIPPTLSADRDCTDQTVHRTNHRAFSPSTRSALKGKQRLRNSPKTKRSERGGAASHMVFSLFSFVLILP